MHLELELPSFDDDFVDSLHLASQDLQKAIPLGQDRHMHRTRYDVSKTGQLSKDELKVG